MSISTNNRVGVSKNLELGGNYDLLLVKVEGSFPEGQVTFGFYDVPMKISGLQKVAQVFLKVLMTTKGSDPFYPGRGTLLPNVMVGANIVSNDDELLSDIASAVNDASDQVRSMLNVNTTDLTSTLDSVQIAGLDRTDEGWFLALYLTTLAGEGASVALPFPEFGLE